MSSWCDILVDEVAPELEQRVRERTRELEDSNESLRRSEQTHQQELEILQQVATQLITANGMEALYEQILDTTLAILHADAASIQMVRPERGTNAELKLLGHRGFSEQAAQRWEWVGRGSRTTCGEALRTGRRVFVPDVRECDFMAGSDDLAAFLDAGIHAAQTLPMVSRSGALLGMVTGYWRQSHDLSVSERRALDILARLAADVIERSQADERLRASEARLTETQHLAKVGSWERQIDTGVTYWSDEIRQILGVTNNAATSWPVFVNFVHPEDREKVLEVERNVRSIAAPIEMEYRIIRSDGEVRFVRSIVDAVRDNQGLPVRLTGATQDITEQVKATQLLRESEERLRNAERLAHLGHWQWDLKSNHVSWSEEMFRIFGKASDYVPNYDGVLEAIVPEDRVRIERYVGARLGQRIEGSTEFRIIRPDGNLRTITAVFEVSRDQEGRLASLFGACQDITEVRRAQQESVARQKLESVGTLATGIAHDFNNLLGGILAESELAIAELAAGVHPKQELKAIRDVALRGSEIVRQLMVYAGKESAAVTPVDLSRLVKEMIELLKVSVSKHAALKTDLANDLPAVRADAAQLRQIVMNLFTNASDAIGNRDGVIRVATRCVRVGQRQAEEFGSVVADGNYVQLEVSDTGRGMLPGVQAKVFDPFFTTKSAGHGLGLAIVDGIVRSLKGKVHVASEPGKGTTIQIQLPCGGITTIPEPPSAVEDVAHFSGRATVLVVEDEEILRQAAAKMLRKSGVEVLEAASGSTAIEFLRESGSQIDVILLDITIPGPSSHEVIAEYAKARSDAKVILTSAYSEEMARSIMKMPQVRGFIRKPFHLDDLVKTLRSALSS